MRALTHEEIDRIRGIAMRQVDLIDKMEAALLADDLPLVLSLARQIISLEDLIQQ